MTVIAPSLSSPFAAFEKRELADWVNAEFRHEIGESLRYAIFDLGRLLIRNDPNEYRHKVWRSVVTRIFNQATDVLGTCLFHKAVNILEYHIPRLGLSVLDTDQHDTFLVLLNQDMYRAYESFTCRLILNGAEQGLPEFTWMASLTKSSREYSFSVLYSDKPYVHNNHTHWARRPFVPYRDKTLEVSPIHPQDRLSLPVLNAPNLEGIDHPFG